VIYFAMGYVALAVTRNRNRLAAANTKLLATRQLLGEAVRASERLRIARALNDLIGHHLSALNLHLDLAVRQSGDRVAASICTAADLGKRLMADVRVAIGNERDEHSIDLRQALQTLCSGVPLPRIALDIAADFELVSPKIAHALFCCTQEAITNAMRHANAGAVAISLTRDANAVGLTIEDDGRGMGSRPEGNGLRGLRERIAGHGGSIAISDSLAGGCRIVIHVPHSGESV
jgi:two-component system sensor histidine kinase DesK